MNDISTLLETGINIRQANPAEALIIFNNAYMLSKEAKDEKCEVESVFNMAIAYLNLANYPECYKHFSKALQYEYTQNNLSFKAEVLRGIATQYLRSYDFKEALKYLYQSEQLSIESNNFENLHAVYGSFGSLFNRLKLFDKALEYTLKTMEIAEKMNLPELIQYSKMSVGACYYQVGQYEKANTYLHEALVGDNKFSIANSLHFLAIIAYDGGQLKRSLKYSQRQVDISRKYNYYEYAGLGLGKMGDIMLAEGKSIEALEYYKEGIHLLEEVGENPIRFTLTKKLIGYYENSGNLALALKLSETLSEEHVAHLEKELRFEAEHIDFHREIEKIKEETESEKKNNLRLQEALGKVKKLNERLNEVNREKNDFMALVIHDLKNPLQNIRSSIRLLGTISDEKKANDYTQNILAQTDRMFNLISRLLDYRAIEDGNLKIKQTAFTSEDLFKDIMNNLNPRAVEKNLTMTCFDECSEIQLNTDYVILYQIMENLVSNAIKFSPKNKRIFLKSYSTGEGVTFEVADEGPGFTENDKRKVFSSFARLSAQPTADEGSTGLGLSITRKLGQLIGSKIELESHEGMGAKFYVALGNPS